MKALLPVIGCLFFVIVDCYHPSWTEEGSIALPSNFSKSVIKRYYGIAQLSPFMRKLSFVYQEHAPEIRQLIYNWSLVHQQSDLLNRVINGTLQTKTITALISLWHDYAAFKYIDDDDFNAAFFDCFMYIMQSVDTNMSAGHLPANLEEWHHKTAHEHFITCIIFRFYFLKKTEHLFRYIKKASKGISPTNSLFNFNAFFFNHPLIQSCAQNIFASKSLVPFLSLYSKICAYDYIDDAVFHREFLMLTLLMVQFTQSNEHVRNFFNDNRYASSSTTIKDLIRNELGLSADEFVLYFFRRLYCVTRLACVGECAYQQSKIATRYALKPLLNMWAEFSRYMYLDSQLLVDTSSRDIFLLLNEHAVSSLEYSFASNAITFLPKDFISKQLDDIQPFVHIDDVIIRFYYNERLKDSLDTLILYKHISCSFDALSEKDYKHHAVKECIEQIKNDRTMVAFLFLYQQYTSYYYIADKSFEIDFLKLLYRVGAILLATSSDDTLLTMNDDSLEDMSAYMLFDALEDVIGRLSKHTVQESRQKSSIAQYICGLWKLFFKK